MRLGLRKKVQQRAKMREKKIYMGECLVEFVGVEEDEKRLDKAPQFWEKFKARAN